MGKPSPASRRAAQEAARAAQEASARRRRMLMAAAGALTALVLLAVIALVWHQAHKPKPVAAGSQVTVPHATAAKDGITLAATPAGRPTLVVYEDYQCPWCKKAVDALSPAEKTLVARHEIGIEIHSITLLDSGSNDSSLRAAQAAACADVVGDYAAYRQTVFAHQPAKEGTGYTDSQLRNDFATEAGITGAKLTTFQDCYDHRRADSVVRSVLAQAASSGRDQTTPTYWVRSAGGSTKQMDVTSWLDGSAPTAQELLTRIEATR